MQGSLKRIAGHTEGLSTAWHLDARLTGYAAQSSTRHALAMTRQSILKGSEYLFCGAKPCIQGAVHSAPLPVAIGMLPGKKQSVFMGNGQELRRLERSKGNVAICSA